MSRRSHVAAVALVGAGTLAVAMSPARTIDVARPLGKGIATDVSIDDGEPEGGLVFSLGDGAPGEETPPKISQPTPTTLDDAETKRVLDRLPPLPVVDGEKKPFALREKSLPVPRTGKTVAARFPPPSSEPTPTPQTAGALRVLRHAPDGDVNVAADLSVTFSQPMVAVTSHDELSHQAVPVRLTPQPAGRWRWVGTRTLLFDPDVRFPMATRYQVEVLAGTKSATGGILAAAERWTFTTTTPVLSSRHPENVPTRRDPLLLAVFDQRVDPAEMLRFVRVTAAGASSSLRLATETEIAADKAFRDLWKAAPEGRRIALHPEMDLPGAAGVTVTIAAGAPSAEGPLRTSKPQSWSFQTYGPMRVTGHQCGWDTVCPPGTPWQVTLSNPIDAKKFQRSMVRVAPELQDIKVSQWGMGLSIQGSAKPRTTYTVTLDPSLPDAFGQVLGLAVPLTFNVTAALPSFFVPGNNFVVLDPNGAQRVSAFTTGYARLRVKAYSVRPDDFPAFQKASLEAMRNVAGAAWNVGRLIHETTVPVRGSRDEMVETAVDLAPVLKGRPGHVVLVIQPDPPQARRGPRDVARLWVQSTQIGLDAFADSEELVAWSTSLKDGRPLGGVSLSLSPSGAASTTGADGLGRLALGQQGSGKLLLARIGDDVALLPENTSWWNEGEGWRRIAMGTAQRFFVFDDRHLYRPNEEVKLKGWVRGYGMGRGGDLGPASVKTVSYTLRDSRGNEITKGERPVSALGGFDVSMKLPATMNLGAAQLQLTTPEGGAHHHSFDVQEFRRPEFEVKVTPSDGPYVVGGSAEATVAASYFAGGALPDAEVTWNVSSVPGSFRPPNWDGFAFGRFIPWWRGHWPPARRNDERRVTRQARTGPNGKHVLRIDLDSVTPPQASVLNVSATVMDVNRQAWSDRSSLIVHPATVYVGLRSDRYFVQQGEAMNVDVIVPDLDGKAAAGRPVAVRAERLDWEQVEGEWKEVVASSEPCDLTSAPEARRCTFHPRTGGSYRITAVVRDEKDRPNETTLQLWVAGGKTPPRRDVAQEEAQLIPARKEFLAGEVAEVLVLSPFAPAEGVLTLRRSGLVKTERFTMTGSSHTLRIPLDEAFTPNVHVQVDLVGAAGRTGASGEVDDKVAKRPAFASGTLTLDVPPRERTLKVTARPARSTVEPSGTTAVDVEVKDASGHPVAGGDVAIVVVDEAVLALSGYETPNPLGAFYAPREAGVSDHHSRAHVVLSARPADRSDAESKLRALGDTGGAVAMDAARVAMPAAAPAFVAEMSKEITVHAESAPSIALRTDFGALAFFDPSVTTDGSGRATVTVKLPDSLTRYRIMAVAAAGAKSFGSGESTLTARLPLMVRPSAPRFLNWGDRFELPVVIQNQTDAPIDVNVAVRASNLSVTAGAGRRLRVEANDRAEVRFPMETTGAGSSRIQVAAASGSYSDAAEVTLPVWSPLTTEAFATYGQIDDGSIRQPILTPAGVVPQFGGLEVTTSSTALQALTDAVLYLVSYRFDCNEQIASRVLAVAALRDVLTAFEAKDLPSPEALEAAVKRDVDRLASLQNDDGGFSFWRRGDKSWPYLGIHVAHALQRARAKGFGVPASALERSKNYLRNIESNIPSDYPVDVRRTLIAYALHVRTLMGDADRARARRLVQEAGLDKLSFEALGWLTGALANDNASVDTVATIRRHLDNRTTETASTAHFAVSYTDGAYLLLHSDRRADAVILESLIATDPSSDLIPKLVAGLLGHRKAGRWENTQENVFVLLALDRFFTAYEKTTPDFVARLWLGDQYAGEESFKGRTTGRRRVEIPMSYLGTGATARDLVLSKDGAGRLYYRIGLRYAPAGLRLDPADHGFTVERTYQAVDDPADVRRDEGGTWHIRAGAKVRVRLTLVNEARRYHVALVDPLPGGLEAQNPVLATTGPQPTDPPEEGLQPLARGFWWWPRPWFEHQNLRDERAEAFASLLWEGVHTYSYIARATTPGTFVAPPPTAEEMYQPETFGRGGANRVVIH